jgi:iron-sulfur cluster assembly accessory protein
MTITCSTNTRSTNTCSTKHMLDQLLEGRTQMSVQDDTQARLAHAVAEEALVEKPAHGVLLTDVAAAKVKSLLDQEGRDDLRLRVGVQPGGCSGLVYQLYFDERTLDGDLVVGVGPVEVVIDRMSAPYLDGATVDFADTIEKQGFTIDNPNAGSSCACGDSFS